MDWRAAILALTLLALLVAGAPSARSEPGTPVEGDVYGDWTLSGSPYYLVGNATVPAGQTLTVEAGVTVLADEFVGLKVLGSLRVKGSSDSPVRFEANGTADAGFWRGIEGAAAMEVSVERAIVLHAMTGILVADGPVTIRGGSVLSQNRVGLALVASSAFVQDASISHNGEKGVSISRGSSLVAQRVLFENNPVHISAAASQALVENATFLGESLADVYADQGSTVRLRAGIREGPLTVADLPSRVDVEGVLSAYVTDKFGVPQTGALVLIEDNANGTQLVTTATDAEGTTHGAVVIEETHMKAGAVSFNPFTMTAQVGAAQGSADVVSHGVTEVTVEIPADLTPPRPSVPASFTVNEDVPITFDASASTDNDPSFATTGTFVWRFPELGLIFPGRSVTRTFVTPGTVQGILTAKDEAGNEASASFVVHVLDTTPPTITTLEVPGAALVGETLTFEAAAADNDPAYVGGGISWRFSFGGTSHDLVGPRIEYAFPSPGTWTVTVTVADPSGNKVSEDRSVVVSSPPPPSPLPWVGAGALLFAAAAGLATERGKIGLLSFLLPLYTRIKDDEVLDQFTRGQIYGHIRVHPGDSYTDIKRNLGLNNGTLTYHLDVLEKQGLVRSATRGPRKLFYPVDVPPPEDGGGLAEVQRRILKGLDEAPGIAVTDLAASLGISRQLALYHMRILASRGIVRLDREGLRLCGYLPAREQK